MKIEHFALNVSDPTAMTSWYREHLGCTIARKVGGPADTYFLADSAGSVLVEIYRNPPDQIPNYAGMNPLLLHLAFVSADPEADKKRLLAAGATHVEDVRPDEGSLLVMLRDPWGLAIQLCKRSAPML